MKWLWSGVLKSLVLLTMFHFLDAQAQKPPTPVVPQDVVVCTMARAL